MVVAHRYELHDAVGKGGCGIVYRATDTHRGRTVAVKMLSHSARQEPSYVERLMREQQALRALSGTHAVGAVDLCRSESGALCLVMEWLDGFDLEQHLAKLEERGERMEAQEVLNVMRPVLETLGKAHELGIVHRDVKPANIFLLSGNRGVRLLDFGLSRLQSSATLTAAGVVMGSPSYISPEAWLSGSKAIGPQADLYAAGVVVFRALTGRLPFEGESWAETMQLATLSERPSARAARPDLPASVDAWVDVALAIDPNGRFQYARSFLDALSAALHGSDIPAHTRPGPKPRRSTVPPPATTAAERQNALTTAISRATSLLKRLATSFGRAPAAPKPSPQVAPEPPLPRFPSPPPLAHARESMPTMMLDESDLEVMEPAAAEPPLDMASKKKASSKRKTAMKKKVSAKKKRTKKKKKKPTPKRKAASKEKVSTKKKGAKKKVSKKKKALSKKRPSARRKRARKR